jgi:hypothetical protein
MPTLAVVAVQTGPWPQLAGPVGTALAFGVPHARSRNYHVIERFSNYANCNSRKAASESNSA